MKQLQNIIIEGIDRLGKSSLITNIQNDHPEYVVLHSGKPYTTKYPTETQINYFRLGNIILDSHSAKIIYDRFHLGEYVYGNIYRNLQIENPVEFIQKYETDFVKNSGGIPHFEIKTLLILLTTSSFDFIPNDGLSIDSTKVQIEQDMFKKVFDASTCNLKVMIDVSIFDKEKNCWKFKSPKDIYDEVNKFVISKGYYL